MTTPNMSLKEYEELLSVTDPLPWVTVDTCYGPVVVDGDHDDVNAKTILEYIAMLKKHNEKLTEAATAAQKELECLWSFHGQNLQVANWHKNGDLEALDNFFEENSQDALTKLKEVL